MEKLLRIKKKTAFTLALIAIPILFFVILELCLTVFNYGGSIRLFVSGRGDLARYAWVNPYVCRRFFSKFKMPPDPPNDTFLKEKPENGYRIFVLGGSTTAGYPYGNNIMFTRILERRLADTFPEKTVEMINVATSAINSHALLDFTDEILKREPDAILIYAGHNEYYGALGVASTEPLGTTASSSAGAPGRLSPKATRPMASAPPTGCHPRQTFPFISPCLHVWTT